MLCSQVSLWCPTYTLLLGKSADEGRLDLGTMWEVMSPFIGILAYWPERLIVGFRWCGRDGFPSFSLMKGECKLKQPLVELSQSTLERRY